VKDGRRGAVVCACSGQFVTKQPHQPHPCLPSAATDIRFPAARDAVYAVIKDTLASLGGPLLNTMQVRTIPHGKRD
jgi:hypothetical protein